MSNLQKSWIGAPTTNLLSNSGQLSLWGKAGGITSVADTALAPDKSYTASLVTANGTTNSFISLGGTIVSGNTYTKSVIAKAGTTGTLVLESYDNNGAGGTGYYTTTFNLNNGTSSGTGHTASMLPLGDGWYRCIATRAYTLNTSGGTFYIGAYGSGTGTLYLWHPMMEQGSTASAYTSSSRSSTQAILDITKTNAITAASLSYANNNTFSFNGTSDYVTTPLIVPSPSTTPTTYEVWFKNYSTSQYKGLIGSSSYTNSGFAVGLFGLTTLQILYYNGASIGDVQLSYNSSVLTHCVAIFDGRNRTVYRNGVVVHTSTAGFDALANPLPIYVGSCRQGGWTTAQADIPFVKVYNRALSQAEVTQNFEATRSRYGI